MGNYYISINQMADFQGSTDATKKRIINQQLTPNKFLIPWYQLAKARIKKSFELKGDLKPIQDAMDTLQKRKPTSDRQKTDKQVSLEALERFVKMKLPDVLKNIDYEIVRPENKTLQVSDVDVIVAPEVVIKGTFNGKTVFGAVKIHISKNKPFDLKKSTYVASTIYEYLKSRIATEEDIVMREICICLDVFSGRLVSAPEDSELTFSEVEEICREVKEIWDKAA